ncbi:MAG TPA: FAD-binding oxidoreductase [Beijerinckiaceae bacterium]|jgi:FAD/FMN-containing dehydrogenase
MPQDALLERLAAIVGPRYVLTGAGDVAAYLAEPRELFHGRARCVVRPGSTQEVADVLRACSQAGVAVVPQGGNTGLVGGQIPGQGEHDEVLLSLKRMDRVREVDASSMTITVEAGLTLLRVQEEAEKAGALFPLSLASEGSCTIGGNLATNAGGTAVLAYGNARDLVMGLEVVLADGRVLSNLSKLKKDNTGYDLKHLFMGSEGTLGVITACVLKLFPRPRAMQTAFIGLRTPDDALALLNLAQAMAGGDVKTFEIMSRFGVEIVARHAQGARDPLAQPHPWYVLLELGSAVDDDGAAMMALLEAAMEQGLVEDAAVAASLEQRKDFWRLRELLSEMQKHEGGSIKHDVSVPVASIPRFLEEATAAVERFMPGARPCPFGHLGDGNIHYNVSQPVGMDKQAFLDRWYEMNEVVHGVVTRLHGSISAEHGVGTLKRDLLPGVKDPVSLDVMRAIKRALDPAGVLNPGKVL